MTDIAAPSRASTALRLRLRGLARGGVVPLIGATLTLTLALFRGLAPPGTPAEASVASTVVSASAAHAPARGGALWTRDPALAVGKAAVSPPRAPRSEAGDAESPAPSRARPADEAPPPPPPPPPSPAAVPLPPGATPGTLAPPTRMQIPAIGVDADGIIDLGLADGALEVPQDYGRVGWWTGGATPGERGAAVLAGHVDSLTGPAIFYRLRELQPGDRIEVTRADGTTDAFAVDRVAQFSKDAFPTLEVYGTTPDATLRLITCGGEFDRRSGHYRDNVVVFASLVTDA